jgi:hypothetical protein
VIAEHGRHDLADRAMVLVRVGGRGSDDEVGRLRARHRLQGLFHLLPGHRQVSLGEVKQRDVELRVRHEGSRGGARLLVALGGARHDQVVHPGQLPGQAE